MGLSLLLAIVGIGLVIAGVALLVILKQRKVAIACLIIGVMLIIVPYTLIYVFFE